VTGWFLDASVLLAAEDADDASHSDARRLLEGTDQLATLDLALYEVTNVAITAWNDVAAACRLRGLIAAVSDDGGLVRADPALLEAATELAITHGISAYDAAYVAAASAAQATLVSTDVRDLVARGLARLPADAVAPAPDAPAS
jgi:predicted nucleic acid-binding protein